VLIGGILDQERTTDVTKVPFLGSVPILGALFRHENTTTSNRDLVIEVTPHLLPEQP